MSAESQIPPPWYFTFSGVIDHQACSKLFNSLAYAVNQKCEEAHLLVQSSGGVIGDGIALYNFLRNVPLTINTYNAGNVSSIAILLYLVGKRRIASKTSTFMIHKSVRLSNAPLKASDMRVMGDAAELDDRIVEQILRERINLPEEVWLRHQWCDVNFDANQAKEWGLALEFGEFTVPRGAQLFNIA